MKLIRFTIWFLGISMFMFGILKFIDPFKEWYSVQVKNSNLGDLGYIMGITGEIAVGGVIIFALLFKYKMSNQIYSLLTLSSMIIIMVMMATGIYVHLHPDVPAEVLPLKIKRLLYRRLF